MRVVVADTSPLFYLLSIGHIELLPQLFGTVFIPDAVYKELLHPAAPLNVREWAHGTPDWLHVSDAELVEAPGLRTLGAGERAAISLALALPAELILMDERKGTSVALREGLEVTGTLGVLRLAALRGLINLADSFIQLKRTNFRYKQEIMDALLEHAAAEAEEAPE